MEKWFLKPSGRELQFGEAEKCVPEKCEMRLTETTFASSDFRHNPGIS